MRKLLLPGVVTLLLSGGWSFCQETQSQEARFQEAWYREVAEGRFEDALETYRELASQEALSTAFRARALFRCGVVLRKLQRKEDALETFQRVLTEFPEEQDVVLRARREIEGETEAQASLRKKVEGLVRLLADKDPRTRSSAQSQLRSIGPTAAPSLLEVLGGGEYYAVDSATRLLVGFADDEPTLIPALVGALRSGDSIVRKSITGALYKTSSERWLQVLLELLRDRDAGVRVVAASVLGDRASPAALEALEALASDSSAEVRAAVLVALKQYRQPELLPLFVKGLGDSEEAVRLAALDAIHQGLDSRGEDAIYEVGGESPSSLHVSAVLALLDDLSEKVVARAVTVLSYACESSSPSAVFQEGPVAEKAIARLGRIVLDGEQPEDLRRDAVWLLSWSDREEAYESIVEAIESDSAEVSLAALQALRDREDPNFAVSFLNTVRLSKNAEVRDLAWEALEQFAHKHPLIQEILVEDLPDLGDKAFRVVGLVQWKDRRDLVLGILGHYEVLDRAARVSILHRIHEVASGSYGLPEGIPVAMAGLQDGDAEIQRTATYAAMAFSDATKLTPLLIPLVEVEDYRTRLNAVKALGRTRDVGAVPALVAALGDEVSDIARQAAGALIALKDVEVVERVLPVVVDPLNPQPAQALWVLTERAQPGDAAAIGGALGRMRADLRAEAVQILHRLGNSEAVPFLQESLKDPDPKVRIACLQALSATGGDDIVVDLVGVLDDPEYTVRKAGMDALSQASPARILAEPTALPALGTLLGSREFQMREAVVAVLADLRDRRVIPLLLEALRDGDSRMSPNPNRPGSTRVNPGSSIATRRYTSPTRRTTRTSPRTTRLSIAGRASRALVEMGDRSTVAPLLEMLETGLEKNPWLEAQHVLDVLAERATPDDASLFTEALEKLDPRIRVGVLKILQDLGSGENIPSIVRYLDDGDSEVRVACVEVLAEIPGRSAFDGLIRALSDSDPTVRLTAATALGRRGDKIATGALTTALEKEDDKDAFLAMVGSLEVFAGSEAIPALVRVIKKEGESGPAGLSSYPALESLQSYPAELAVEALESLLADPDLLPGRRYDALSTLSRVRHPKTLDLVLQHAESPDETMRYSVARTLGAFYDARVLPVLVDLLRDSERRVREMAQVSLDKVRYYLEQKRFAEQAARDRSALEELHALLEDPNPAVRMAAVKALVRLESLDSLAVLVRLRKDENEDVRKTVDEALETLSRSSEAAPR